MKKDFKEINPKLKIGDRVILIHMSDYSVPIGSKGLVRKITPLPKHSKNDPDFGYVMKWFDENEKQISSLSLIPNDDAWIYDKEYYESNSENIQEEMFRDVDDLVEWGNFLTTFGKEDLNSICEFFELERKSGFFNMHTEGGKFLLTGPDYIKSFIDLKKFEHEFDNKDKKTHKLLLSRAQKVRDIFIRGAMKYLEEKEQELEIPNIQKTMQRLARTSKIWWMRNADKYLNKEIK